MAERKTEQQLDYEASEAWLRLRLGGSRRDVAAQLGISPSTLDRRLERFRLGWRGNEHLVNMIHIVYRIYGAAGLLLYVGCTSDLDRRLYRHKREQPWWPDAVTLTTTPYLTKAEGYRAEAVAIRTELPLHNVPWNSDRERWAAKHGRAEQTA